MNHMHTYLTRKQSHTDPSSLLQVASACAAELVRNCADGPRLSERGAAIFAAFIGGLAAGIGAEVAAICSAQLALKLVDTCAQELSQPSANLTQVDFKRMNKMFKKEMKNSEII
jgi:hypothetical protein